MQHDSKQATPPALPSANGCAPSIEEVRARRNAIQLERCAQMLTEAGVPEWVELSDSSVPSNAVTYRLKWFLARRKDVKPSEIDKRLKADMEAWERQLAKEHNNQAERQP